MLTYYFRDLQIRTLVACSYGDGQRSVCPKYYVSKQQSTRCTLIMIRTFQLSSPHKKRCSPWTKKKKHGEEQTVTHLGAVTLKILFTGGTPKQHCSLSWILIQGSTNISHTKKRESSIQRFTYHVHDLLLRALTHFVRLRSSWLLK